MSGIKKLLVCLIVISLAGSPALGESPPTENLPLAELWTQTSAEHAALCLQAYNVAADQFERWAPLFQKRDDGLAYLPGSDKPLAVILDLDETVLDNSGYQAFLYENNTSYNSTTWSLWAEFQSINKKAGAPVEGSVEFLLQMEEMGITPLYVSNRGEAQKEATIKTLKNLGLNMTDIESRVLLRQKGEALEEQEEEVLERVDLGADTVRKITEGEGGKEGRRRLLRRKYDVLAYFGDVYGDFEPFLAMADSTKARYEQRTDSVVENSERWGRTWFILPNPMYGTWSVGETIPKGEASEALNDFGFSIYLRGRKVVR